MEGMQKDKLRPEKSRWMCFRTGVQLPSAPPKFQLIPPDTGRYLLFLAGFCNGKRCFKISVDIPVDLLFELMLHYKQARGAERKRPAPAPDDTGIRLSGAAVHRRTGLPI